MILRKYQAAGKILVSKAFDLLKQVVILCIPTGGGKTVVFADMAKEAMNNGVTVMILCNRIELIDQARKKLNALGLFPVLILPGKKEKRSNLYLASVDTLRNRPLPEIGLLIVDEGHLRDFDEFILYYKHLGVHVVVCTATPLRYGKRLFKKEKLRKEFQHLPEVYPDYTGQMCDVCDELVIPTTISELITDQYLVPAITYTVKVDLSDVGTSSTFGEIDFNEKQLFNKANNPISYASVVNKYLELAPGTKAICFDINVEHSKKQCEEFKLRGIPAVHVNGKTPKEEREKAFELFAKGHYMVLNNCGIATTGYDEPTIETVICNFATMSLVKWLQCCGRGGRLCDEIGKTFFNIIDMYGNVYRHMWWEFENEFSLDKKFVSKKIGVAPIKECEHCQAVIAINATVCQYCTMLQEKKITEAENATMRDAGEFEIVDKEIIPKELKKPLHKMTVPELEKFRELKGYAVGWIVRQLLTRGVDDIKEYAKLKNYAQAWATKQIELAEKGREDTKDAIWEFIQKNPHLEENYLKDYAAKKLKSNHNAKEIEILIPVILKAFKDFHAGLIKVE